MAARRPAALASVLLALAVTAPACASDPPADAAPPNATVPSGTSSAPTTTTSAPPTTTTQAPVDPVVAKIPKAARANTQEGAEAFAEFFVRQIGQGFAKADPGLIGGLYTKECKTCVALHEGMASMRSDRQRHERVSIIVGKASAQRFVSEDPKKVIAVPMEQVRVDVVDAKGVAVDSTEASKGAFVLTLTWEKRWVIRLAQAEEY